MPDMKTYTGGCHCGRFRYEVDTELAQVIECNCSHCHKKGLVLTFVTPDAFRLMKGDESELAIYQFNRKRIHHAFCPTCGVESFAWGTTKDGNTNYSINVRCLDDVELDSLAITAFSGKDF